MLIWHGQSVPGTEHIRSFAEDPKVPDWSKVATRRYRGGVRRRPIDTAGIHTWRALRAEDSMTGEIGLVHFDPARHRLRALEVISGHKGTTRKAAYHFYVDHDGTVYQCADPARWWTYHGAKNDRSVGIGIAQGSRRTPRGAPDQLVTIEAVDAAAELVELLFDRGLVVVPDRPTPHGASSIPFCGWKPPVPPKVRPPAQTIPVADVLELWRLHGRLVLGHGHSGRKTHDPGEHVWARLGSRPGWERVWP